LSAVDIVEVVLGALLLGVTMYDIFQSVVMPRPAVGRIRFSSTLVRQAWPAWLAVAGRLKRNQRREAALAAYAPLMVVVLLVLWGFSLVLAYSLLYSGLHDGLRPQPGSFGATLFYSAGRMLAFPAGGIEATAPATQVLGAVEAASGFGLFALVISLLFSLFSAFQRRETAVVALDALAGAPPSGVQLLENCARHHMPEQLVATFGTWQNWTADVLESHLSYPVLFFFRSSHDNEAWSNSLGAVMDAATLVLSTIEGGPNGQAHLMFKVGDHFITDMRQNLGIQADGDVGLERGEFLEAAARLQRAGYRLRNLDEAWNTFNDLRSRYGAIITRISRRLDVPPAPWIGDRSYLPHRDGREDP